MADRLAEAAEGARGRAYAPYSGFTVGAALEADDGRIFVGVNVENASYGLTNCAERVAVGTAVAAGAKRFRRIVIASGSKQAAPPCGACRQVLAEFGSDLVVEAVSAADRRRWILRDLLPDAFGPEVLR